MKNLDGVFVPVANYVATLKLALELALELCGVCSDHCHRDQAEQIDEALAEVGEHRPPLQLVADMAPLRKLPSLGDFARERWSSSLVYDWEEYEPQEVEISEERYKKLLPGSFVETRGRIAFLSGVVGREWGHGTNPKRFSAIVRFAEKVEM